VRSGGGVVCVQRGFMPTCACACAHPVHVHASLVECTISNVFWLTDGVLVIRDLGGIRSVAGSGEGCLSALCI
jgi:hypothetical protein